MAMSKTEFRKLLITHTMRQADVAWMMGVSVRQVRAWALGEYPVPQSVELLLRAYCDGHLNSTFFAKNIKEPGPW